MDDDSGDYERLQINIVNIRMHQLIKSCRRRLFNSRLDKFRSQNRLKITKTEVRDKYEYASS